MTHVTTPSSNRPKDTFRLYASDIRGKDGSVYMYRYVLQTPWGTLRLHKIMRPDESVDLHDHPWWFLSVLLTGRYVEVVPSVLREGNETGERCMPCRYGTPNPCIEHTQTIRLGRFGINRKAARDLHRIIELPDGPVWTFVVTGPYERKWGFQTKDGWVYWRDHPESDVGAA